MARRVTFTDWRGSLLVYAVIWLTPVYLAWVFTGSAAPWLLAPFIYLVMMAQHKLHRARGLTTAARYERIDAARESRWFAGLLAAAYTYLAAVAAAAGALGVNTVGLLLAAATAALIMLYSGPLHREWWIGVTHWLGTVSAFATARPPTLPEALFAAGFSSLVWMLHKGLRIVTGDYGPVPVELRHMLEVFAAWGLAVALLLASIAAGV